MYTKPGPWSSPSVSGTTTIFAAVSPQHKHEIHQNGNLVLEAVGSNMVRKELGAFGEKFLESSSAFLQSNFLSRYVSSARYYFQVNDDYVRNKVKLILLPFLHKGHWIRGMEVVGREFSFKPPIYDINAPDLYIPMMAFPTYLLLVGFLLGINGKFSPEALGVQFTTAMLCWLLQILLLGATLHTLALGGGEGGGGGGEGGVPLLDLVAYGGYTFIAASVIISFRIIISDHPMFLWVVMSLWESLCMGIFMVKTTKRILATELKCVDHSQSNKRNYLLLSIALSQIPLLLFLGTISVKTSN